MKTDRVVFDPNIFISLILSHRLDRLVTWYKDYGVQIYVCRELFEELNTVLNRA